MAQAGIKKATEYTLKNKGDVLLGKKLFNKQGCITCHAVSTKARQKGPYLGTAGTQFTRPFLVESILEPSKAIAQGFPTYHYKFNPKRRKTDAVGFLVNEDNKFVYLMDMQGKQIKFKREGVLKKTIVDSSMMPPLAFTLTLHEFSFSVSTPPFKLHAELSGSSGFSSSSPQTDAKPLKNYKWLTFSPTQNGMRWETQRQKTSRSKFN